MPAPTTELGLQAAVATDLDPTYLTVDLAGSLAILDGLFSATTGHNHSGPGQGGPVIAAVPVPLDVPGMIRSTDQITTGLTGPGVNMWYDATAGTGHVQAWDFDTLAYLPLALDGSVVTAGTLHATVVGVGPAGEGVLAYFPGDATYAAELQSSSNFYAPAVRAGGAVTAATVTASAGVVGNDLRSVGGYVFAGPDTHLIASGGALLYRANGHHFQDTAGAASSVNASVVNATGRISGGDFYTAGAIRAHGGVIYFEGSDAVMLRWRGDLGAMEFPYGNGLYTTTLTLSGNCNAAAFVGSRLVIAAWDVGTAVTVGGDIRCSGSLWTDSNNLWFAGGAARIFWDGTYMQSTGGYYAPGKIASAGQVHCWASHTQGEGNGFLTPNIADNRGQGLAQEWRTYSSVAHAIQYGLRADPITDPLAAVQAIQGYHYDHINFAPSAEPQPILNADGTPQSVLTFGFLGSEVQAVLPELYDGHSLSATRMTPVLWEALKQYIAQTDARLAALETPPATQSARRRGTGK